MKSGLAVADHGDADLSALADARRKARQARDAFEVFEGATQEQADRIVRAMAAAAAGAADELARLAVEETGCGIYEDKILKNLYNARFVADAILRMRTLGVLWVDEPNRLTALGSPMGVIAAVIPMTNPTSTVIFKCLIGVKAGNAVVCAPHPRAAKCCLRAAEVLAAAAEKAGAPRGLVSCLEQVTLPATQELMQHRDVSLVLATGGSAMVRAAYSSGKPTFAVGPGNSPVYVHRSAKNLAEAATMIVTSKAFDNGTACVAEQAVVLDEPVAEAAIKAFEAQKTFFLPPADQAKLIPVIFTESGELRPSGAGLAAAELAKRAGIRIPEGTRVLGALLDQVGPQAPLSREILGPVLVFYRAHDAQAAYRRCLEVLEFGGEGHTLGVHATDEAVIARFSSLPASRILINTPLLFGGMGFSAALEPSFMLGTGTWSGSIVSDNVTPLHLINIKRVAHESRPWRSLYDSKMGL